MGLCDVIKRNGSFLEDPSRQKRSHSFIKDTSTKAVELTINWITWQFGPAKGLLAISVLLVTNNVLELCSGRVPVARCVCCVMCGSLTNYVLWTPQGHAMRHKNITILQCFVSNGNFDWNTTQSHSDNKYFNEECTFVKINWRNKQTHQKSNCEAIKFIKKIWKTDIQPFICW